MPAANLRWATGLSLLPILAGSALVMSGKWRPFTQESEPLVRHAPAPAAPAVGTPVAIEPPPQVFRPMTPQEAIAKNAQTPFASEKMLAARPLKLVFANSVDQARALNCLTQAVYYEAGFEPAKGRRAVAQVVLNRLRHPIFPKTVCGVVFQGSELPTGCQFTFTCDGSLARPPEIRAWREAQDIAQAAIDGKVEPSVGWATHYHTIFVVPYWMPTLTKLSLIGAHIFYRWPQGMGLSAAFTGAYAGGEPTVFGAPPPKLIELAPANTVQTRPSAEVQAATVDLMAPADGSAGGAGNAPLAAGHIAAADKAVQPTNAELTVVAPPKIDMTPQWFGSNRPSNTPIGVPGQAPRP